MSQQRQTAQVPVSLFNANVIGVQVSVNNGPQTPIAATSSNILFVPQRPKVNPSFSNVAPAPGVLAPGDNLLNITPQGEGQPRNFTLHLPKTQQYISLQLYIYWNTTNTVAWVALNNGQFLAAGEG